MSTVKTVALVTGAALVTGSISTAFLPGWVKRRRPKREAGQPRPEYVWLAFAERYASPFGLAFPGAETAETTERTYQGAYILLMARVRMELMMVEFFTEGGALLFTPQTRVVERVTYSTEAFQPYLGEIRSLEDFGRYAPYRSGSLKMMKLSVHPDDADEAVTVLERAGIAAETSKGPQPWWHTHHFPV